MLAGQVVDWQVNAALEELRAGKNPNDLVNKGLAAWRRLLANSKSQADQIRRGVKLPRGAQPLFSDYYGLAPEPEREQNCEERVARSISGLLESEVWDRIQRVSQDRWSPPRDPMTINAFEWDLDGITVWSSIDLWLDFRPKGIVVIDWKTGGYGDPGEALQIASYSLWGQRVNQLSREQVLVQAPHLRESPGWAAKPVSEVTCEVALATVKAEYETELARVEIIEDEFGVRRFRADRSRFPAEPDSVACLWCKFREICPEGQAMIDQ